MSELKRDFNDTLRDRLQLIPKNWQFPLQLPNVPQATSISVIPLENAEHVYVLLHFTHPGSGVDDHITFTLDNNGMLMGRIPQDLAPLTRDQILKALISDCKRIDLDRCADLNYSVFASSDLEGFKKLDGAQPEDFVFDKKATVDPARLELLNSLGALTIFRGNPDGPIRQYYVAIFSGKKDFALLESPHLRNAAFVIPIDLPVSAEEIRAMSRADKFLLGELLQPQLSITRRQAGQVGTRIVHIGHNWKARITQEIQQNLG